MKIRPVQESEWQPLAFDITDEASLAEAGDVLHDAIFSLDETTYDEEAGVFTLTARREVPELARQERVWRIIPRIRMPRVRTTLTLRGVREAVVEERDAWGLDPYTLLEIEYNAETRALVIYIAEPLTMEFEVEGIAGRLEDIGRPTWDEASLMYDSLQVE